MGSNNTPPAKPASPPKPPTPPPMRYGNDKQPETPSKSK